MDINKSRELRSALKKFSHTSTMLAVVLFGVDLFLYVFMVAGTFVFESAALKVGCSVSAGLVISSLFVIGHDAAHNSYTGSRRLNILISYVALLPALHNYSLWRVAHSRFHHVHTNQKGMNSWAPLSKNDYDHLPLRRRFVEQLYRTPLGIGVYYMVERWWKYKLFPARRAVHGMEGNYWRDFSIVLSFIIIFAGALGYFGAVSVGSTVFSGIMFGFVLPFIVWNYAMGLAVYLQHTNQKTPWFDNLEEVDGLSGQEEVTVHVVFPEWYGFISHYIMEHTAHHVLPTIPMYHLKDAQKKLKDILGDAMIQETFTFSYLFHTISACKIYDYESHQWQNFKGEYTTGCTLPDRMKDNEMSLDKQDARNLKYA